MTVDVPPAVLAGTEQQLSTIAGVHRRETVVKRSRFLTRVEHVTSVEEADAVIAAVRKEHWDARHSCVALVVGPAGDRQRSNDDGEPSGTAGVPMLEVLRQRGLTDVVAVVTRYFGGVLLGAGGLVRAYSSAVSEALDEAVLVRRETMLEVDVVAGHALAGRTEHVLREWSAGHGARVVTVTYGAEVTVELLVPPARLRGLEETVAASSAGAVSVSVTGWRVADVPTA